MTTLTLTMLYDMKHCKIEFWLNVVLFPEDIKSIKIGDLNVVEKEMVK